MLQMQEGSENRNLLANIIFRQVTRNDLVALEWDGEYTHFRRIYQDAFRLSQQGWAVLWAADLIGKGIIGQLFVHLRSERGELADGKTRAYIYGFRVRPEYRNRKIGTRMLEVAETDLRRRGFRWVVLNVARDNEGARRLYERFGYQVVAEDPGRWSYFDDKGVRREVCEPAWRMEKDMAPR